MKKIFFILFAFLSFQGFSQSDLDFANQICSDITADIYVTDKEIGCEQGPIFLTTAYVPVSSSFTASIPAQYSLAFVQIDTVECDGTVIIKPQTYCGYLNCDAYTRFNSSEQSNNDCCPYTAYFYQCNAIIIS